MTLRAPRLVVDPNVLIAVAIGGRGAPAQLLAEVSDGRATLVASPKLLQELRGVLGRERFRRWLSLAEAESFAEAIGLLAESVGDPVGVERTQICRDPDDDYLVHLTLTSAAHALVSGDQDLLELHHDGLKVLTPRQVLDALTHVRPWVQALVRGKSEEAWEQTKAEGHDAVMRAAAVFLTVLQEEQALEALPLLVTPESLPAWVSELERVSTLLADRGMTSRADYPAPDIAYVKLPPDPGVTLQAVGEVLLPADTVLLTLQRRPKLADVLDLGGWRVHAVGDAVAPQEMPLTNKD